MSTTIRLLFPVHAWRTELGMGPSSLLYMLVVRGRVGTCRGRDSEGEMACEEKETAALTM